MPRKVSASELRRLAEHADGLRGKGPRWVGRPSDNDPPDVGNYNPQTGMFEIETELYNGSDMTPPGVVLVEN